MHCWLSLVKKKTQPPPHLVITIRNNVHVYLYIEQGSENQVSSGQVWSDVLREVHLWSDHSRHMLMPGVRSDLKRHCAFLLADHMISTIETVCKATWDRICERNDVRNLISYHCRCIHNHKCIWLCISAVHLWSSHLGCMLMPIVYELVPCVCFPLFPCLCVLQFLPSPVNLALYVWVQWVEVSWEYAGLFLVGGRAKVFPVPCAFLSNEGTMVVITVFIKP